MVVLFDLMHPAHVNFFKNSIYQAKEQGHRVVLSVLQRGKLPAIVLNEMSEFEIHLVGKHKGSILSIIFQANLIRFISMFFLVSKIKPDIGFSVGSFILGFNMKIRGKTNYQFDDDPERPINVLLEKVSATKLFFPMIYQSSSKKVKTFNSLKEWSYLSPKYFALSKKVLKEYKLIEKQYVFIREVSTGSLNYKGQKAGVIAGFCNKLPPDMTYVLSLEDKSRKHLYPKNWIILKEPVDNIHSLMYCSKLVISSGDSMAREGAMLGVDAVYCGSREMKANDVLINKNKLRWIDPTQALAEIILLIKGDTNSENQLKFRQQLDQEWDDVNSIIFEKIKN